MNKTVNINISGFVFHIEEDAYDTLKRYMHEIKVYFSRSAEDTEVLTDIENRIAEMFSETLAGSGREVIVIADVEAMIAQIGQVSDFDEASGEELPPPAGEQTAKRLFRDPDDKKLGGVCAGISHYFNWDPVWLRIITALLTIFTSGIVALVYIILWMVMPQAKTLAEKMAMKGERFHLSNFRKSFDEEMSGVKATFDHLKNEVRNPDNSTSFKRFMNELIDLVAGLIRGLGKILLPVIAALLIAFGSIWLISAVVGIVGYTSFGDAAMMMSFPFNVLEPQHKTGLAISAAAVIAIPAIAIVLLGARMLLKTRTMNTSIGLGMLAVWLIALGFTVYYSASTMSGFRQGASLRQVSPLLVNERSTWYLELDDYAGSYNGTGPQGNMEARPTGKNLSTWRDYDENFDDWDELDEELYEVELKVEQSNTGSAALVQVYNSRGKDFDNAIDNARNIVYGFAQRDSILRFGQRFSLRDNALWRAQKVDLTLQLPAGSELIIDPKLRRILDNHELHAYDFGRVDRWVMTGEGLKPTPDGSENISTGADTTAQK